MKLLKKHKIIVLSAIFCAIYILFAMRPLGKELHLTPEWTEDIFHTGTVPEKSYKELIPFRLGQNLGYFTEDGIITNNITFPYKASVSENYYITYGANSNSADFYTPEGIKAGTAGVPGFPFFDKDRLYVFLPGGTSFVKCDSQGNVLWKYEGFSPVTAFSTGKNGTAAGFADGTLITFNNDGSVNHKFAPKGSEYEIILGAGISSDGKAVACISGKNRQRFVAAKKENGHSRIVFHEYLEDETINQSLVKFSLDDEAVYYNYKDHLGIYSFSQNKSFHIPIEGIVTQIEESDTEGLVFVLSELNGKYTVTVLEKYDHITSKFSFDAECAFIQVRGKNFYIGRNSKISRLTVSKK